MTRLTPQQAIDHVLATVSQECAVIVRDTSRADLRWARSTLTTNGEARGIDITVVSFFGAGASSSTASVGTALPDRAGLTDLVARAEAAARSAQPADDAFELLRDADPSLNWDDPSSATSGAVFAEAAHALGSAFAANDGLEHFGYAEHSMSTTWLATSTGVRRRFEQPEGRLEMTAKSHHRSRSSWWGAATNDFTDVDPSRGVEYLRTSLRWQERRIDVAPGRHDCILTPGAIGDLMVDMWWSAGGREALEGRSVFSAPGGRTRIGERIAVPGLTLSSDPNEPGMASADFMAVGTSSPMASVYDNGLPVGRVDWISDGVLTNLMTTRAYAAESGLALAAPADSVRLSIDSGSGSLDDVIQRTHDGLLITCLWYNRLVDPQTLLLTGLTRDGVYVVRDGEVIGAAGNFRFNDSPVSIGSRIVDAGETSRCMPREFGDYANRVAMPPVLVCGFNLSTPSDAV